jgi:hypothetical protein
LGTDHKQEAVSFLTGLEGRAGIAQLPLEVGDSEVVIDEVELEPQIAGPPALALLSEDDGLLVDGQG